MGKVRKFHEKPGINESVPKSLRKCKDVIIWFAFEKRFSQRKQKYKKIGHTVLPW